VFVRRIFTMYAEGAGLAAIASALNADGIPAPYDGPGREKPAGRGWSTNTLHSMLRNERYIGKTVWNKRTWFRPQHAKSRRSRLRPRKEWRERPIDPALAIVAEDLWARVQGRVAARALAPRGARDRKFVHLLSGLLRCGSCGASMSVVSRRKKGAVSYANFGCSANHSKGEHICSNNLTVSERKVNEAVLDAVRKLLESPKFGDRFVEVYEKRQKEKKARGGVDREAVQREVRALEARVEKVTEAIATVGHSDTLLAKLRAEETKLAEARAKLASLAADQAEPEERPDPAQVRRQFEDLSALLDRAPERARDAARRLLTDIILTPAMENDEQVYEAVGGVKTSSAAHLGGRVLVNDGCGGRI
jgi:site-specific DNA recombinase